VKSTLDQLFKKKQIEKSKDKNNDNKVVTDNDKELSKEERKE